MAVPSDNVVPIGARARPRPSAQEASRLVGDCRDLALDRIAGAMAGMLDRVEDDLFALAEKAKDRDTQNLYLDARAQARARRPAMETAFRLHFLECFDKRARGDRDGTVDPEPRADTLSLVDDEALERSIAVQEMAARLQGECENELRSFAPRMAYLLGRAEGGEAANPLGPETVCRALLEACDRIEAGHRVRLTLLRALESQVSHGLSILYRDLNRHLVERQVLPDLRPVAKRQPGAPKRADAPPEADLFSALSRLMAADAAVASPFAAFATPRADAMLPPATQGFVAELSRLQQPGAAGAAAAPGAAPSNVIRDLRGAPQSAQLGSLDALTIDIVAMLFDYVFEDRQIPPAVKAVLARLQIPTLKVALIDKAFFSSRAHPARRLLDRLAEAAIGLDEKTPRGAEALAKIESIVGRVQGEFETDIGLFTALTAELDAFLAEAAQAEDRFVRQAATVLEAREREEIARLTAEAEVDGRLAAREAVPGPVRSLLAGPWVDALARVALDEGEATPAWKGLVAAMDELLWSVEPKSSPEDRRRLVNGLPALLRALQGGLERAGLPFPEREAFFGALVDCHADAVKAGLKGTALPKAKPQEAPAPAPEAPRIERAVLPAVEGELAVEEIRLRTPRGAPPVRNVFTRTGIWTNVQRFSWVEFGRGEGEPVRARLTWISPAKGVYLFTNPQARAAISITPEALAEQMRRGEARLVDDAPLVDRAVDSMLANLRERAA